jgi:hypothetical protein
MVNVTFVGSVSDQIASNEEVILTITSKDYGTSTTIKVYTAVDKSFTTIYDTIPGAYGLVASVGEDAVYTGASSTSVDFTVGKLPRTITVNVV